MLQALGSLKIRDFSTGLIRPSRVANALIPDNAVTEAFNVGFERVGGVRVRKGYTKLGADVSTGINNDGIAVLKTSSLNYPIAAFGGTTYYYNGSAWGTISGSFTSGNKMRFETLGNRIYTVNGVELMQSWTGTGSWGTTNALGTYKPKFVKSYKSRLYAAGDATNPDRVFFSSVIDSSNNITWPAANYLDVNPSDGSNIMALEKISNFLIILKETSMYRWDGSSTQADVLVDQGTTSQESVKQVKGVLYFFNPYGVWRTTGGYPEWISSPVQDYIEAVPQSAWSSVAAYSDHRYYEVFIGNVTVDGTAHTNVSLRFDTVTSTWTVRKYANVFRAFVRFFSTTQGAITLGATSNGKVMQMDIGNSDDSNPIFYSMTTKEFEGEDRASIKNSTSRGYVFTKNGGGSHLEALLDEKPTPVKMVSTIIDPVTFFSPIAWQAHYVRFKWYGSTTTTQPEFDGFTLTDLKTEGTYGR